MPGRTRAALALTYLVVSLDITAIAASTAAASSDTEADRALASLARLLDTDISTRDAAELTDETPGIVAVLEGRDLRNAGVATVREALALIPGIDLPAPQFVRDEPVVRGVGGFFTGSSGKLRYMVNGAVTNNVINANSTATLDIPVALVERIELIRGAGSALHGEYAYLATLNVVTRQSGDAAGIEFDSFEGYRVSARTGFDVDDDGKASLAVAFDDTPGEERRTGEDLFHATGFGALSNAPGDAHLAQRNYQVFFNLQNGGVALNAFALGKQRADAFGASNALTSDDSLNREIEHAGIDLEVAGNVGAWDVTGRLGVQRFRREGDAVEILPAGAFGVYPDALVASSSEGEDRFEADMTFGRDIGRHRLLTGVELARSEAEDIFYAPNFDERNELPGPFRLPAPLDDLSPRPLGYEGRSRDVVSAFVSDRYRASDALEATLGVRVDDYSDVGSSTSPRAALSYRVNEDHVVKGQLSRAFRPPSFLELYTLLGSPAGNSALDAETIDTAEIAHVYRRDDILLQTSIFSSRLDDLIRTDERSRFINAAGVRAEGVEFEFDYRPGPTVRWFGNVSWLDAEDEDTGERVAGSTDWLANLGVSIRRGSRFSGVLRYRYVGNRYRGENDPREPLDGYGTFHAALSWRDVVRPGVTVRFGVDNFLDDEARDPSPFPGYEDDYPGPGREFWLRITREFR